MANRSFHKHLGSLEIDVVHLYGSVTFGSTGAVASYTGKGIASVTFDSTGQYKINLSDTYSGGLLWGTVGLKTAVASDPTTVGILARLEDDQSTAVVPYVQVQFYALDDGVAANPASGAVALFKLELKNSTLV